MPENTPPQRYDNATGCVLITRPAEDAADYVLELAAAGFSGLSAPMLEIVPQAFTLPNLQAFQALLFTSAHAVRAFSAALPVGDKAFDLPLYVVGKQTASVAAALGFHAIRDAHGTGDDLAAMVTQQIADRARPLLHVRGTHVARPLDKMLADQSFVVDTLVVYTAEKTQDFPPAALQALREGCVEAVTFFSRRTALNFMDLAQENNLLPALKSTKALCISDSVLECVQTYTPAISWRGTYSAAVPDRSGMLELLRRTSGGRQVV